MLSGNKPKQPDNVFSHWYAVAEDSTFSAVEFYDGVEAELNLRKVPRLRTKRVEYHEGSALSDRRLYLRLARERFAFEVCAAPFGTSYFFSVRFVEIPRGGWVKLLAILTATALVLGVIGMLISYAFFKAGGSFWLIAGLVAVLGIVASAVVQSRKRNAAAAAAAPESAEPVRDFDTFLLGLPVIGEWYERHRKDTYYRHDTRMLYQNIVSEVVKKRVEEVTAAKGVKLLQTYDYNPILGELYKPRSVKPGSAAADRLQHGVD